MTASPTGTLPARHPYHDVIVQKQAESSLLRKDLSKKEVLLDIRRIRESSKKIILKDQFIISWESI
jgi:hypothetical protein